MKDKTRGEKKGKFLWIALVAVLVVVLAVIVGIAVNKNKAVKTDGSDIQEEQTTENENNTAAQTTEEEPDQKEGTEDFAIFGVDSRSNQLGQGTRSDSIMLVHVNHDDGEITVVSVYRDCMVHQEGKGYEKITHAHAYGGPEFALSVINENFDLNIENYVTVNFGAMKTMVDKIGGVEIELNDKEIEKINESSTEQLSGAGVHLLNGEQALAFSRIRKLAGGDYRRAERQREVLFEIFEKAKSMESLERLQLVNDMMDQINTNYTNDEITSLLYYLSKYEIVTMDAYPKVFYGGIVEGAWVEVPVTLVDMNTGLHKVLLGETDYSPSATVEDISWTLQNKVDGANTDLTD